MLYGASMKIISALALTTLFIGCASQGTDTRPRASDGKSDGVSCETVENADDCLDVIGCAWGTRASGTGCYYVGEIVPQSGTNACDAGTDVTSCLAIPGCSSIEDDYGNFQCLHLEGPAMQDVCEGVATESACLATEGCAWGTRASGTGCFYVGIVVPL